jgi:hypothetical protein
MAIRVPDVLSLRATNCDTGHYIVVANVRERLAVSKQTKQSFCMERFNVNKLNKAEGKKRAVSCLNANRFAVLEKNIDAGVILKEPGKLLDRISKSIK